MLNEIFSKYRNDDNEEDLKNEEIDEIESDNDNIKIDKPNKQKNSDFLNEKDLLTYKKKSEEVMSKYCTLYSKEYAVKPLNENYLEKKRRREENRNSTGPKWFNMKAPELTTELKQELKAVQLGKLSEPFQFHKKNDRKGYAKFFQIGTIQDNILDGKANRLKKNEIKNRIAEQLLDYDLEQNFTLRKFNEYQEQRKKLGIKKSKLNKFKLKSKGKKIGVGVVSKS
jgi:hypothetical protein